MAQASAAATYERIHEAAQWHDGLFRDWSDKPSALHPYHFTHGVRIWVSTRNLTPDDKFLTPPLFVSDDEDDEDEGDARG